MTGIDEEQRRVLLNRLYRRYKYDGRLVAVRQEGRGVLVPGDGPVTPRLMFVGEAPGAREEALRRPFVGASGRFLNELLQSVGILRSEVFVTNAVKYHPKGNRNPTNEEIAAGIPYLRAEHGLIGRPAMVMLGKHATKLVQDGYELPRGLRIAEWFWAEMDGGFPVLPLFHPAYGLYQASNKPKMFEQFKAVLNPPTSPEEIQ